MATHSFVPEGISTPAGSTGIRESGAQRPGKARGISTATALAAAAVIGLAGQAEAQPKPSVAPSASVSASAVPATAPAASLVVAAAVGAVGAVADAADAATAEAAHLKTQADKLKALIGREVPHTIATLGPKALFRENDRPSVGLSMGVTHFPKGVKKVGPFLGFDFAYLKGTTSVDLDPTKKVTIISDRVPVETINTEVQAGFAIPMDPLVLTFGINAGLRFHFIDGRRVAEGPEEKLQADSQTTVGGVFGSTAGIYYIGGSHLVIGARAALQGGGRKPTVAFPSPQDAKSSLGGWVGLEVGASF